MLQMLTNEMISKFYQDVNSLGLKFPVAAIAKETGYSKGNVSGYLKGNQPSENFISAFYRKFSDRLDKVPKNATTATETAKISPISKNMHKDNRTNKLTTTTAKIDYGMRPTNGNQGKDTPVDLNITIQEQALAARIFAEAHLKDRDIMLALTRIIEDKNLKK